jgi:hypothetical protein
MQFDDGVARRVRFRARLSQFPFALHPAKEKGDWLPACMALITLGSALGGRVPVPFFRAPAEGKPL